MRTTWTFWQEEALLLQLQWPLSAAPTQAGELADWMAGFQPAGNSRKPAISPQSTSRRESARLQASRLSVRCDDEHLPAAKGRQRLLRRGQPSEHV